MVFRPFGTSRGTAGGEWLEPVLARHLGRVRAPDELWERVRPPRVATPIPRRSIRLVWAVPIAALLVLAAVWGLHARPEYASAVAGLRSGSGNLQFRSSRTDQVRAWVKSSTGLDIPLSSERDAGIELAGARVSGRSAELVYRAAQSEARLLVSPASGSASGERKHRFLGRGTYDGAKVASWVMRGQLYTLAYASAGDLRAACALCHASENLAVLN